MKLYVCWGTFPVPTRPGNHPCRNAYHALRDAGHEPEVVKTYSLGAIPELLQTPQRKEVKRLTGSLWVPALVLDDGTAISGSDSIIAWAKEHRAAATPTA
jgi:hypothetical protein